MPVRKLPDSFDTSRCFFYDDFSGSLYDDRFWSVAGTGSAAIINGVGGIIQVSSNANSNYKLSHGGFHAFSSAKNAVFDSRAKIVDTSSMYAEIGLSGATQYACFITTSGTWRAYTGVAGDNTITDTGIALDTSFHEFRVLLTAAAAAAFMIDGTIVATHTTDIPTDALQPFVYISNTAGAVRALQIDYIQSEGDRD